MESKKMSIREWVSCFYLGRAMRGFRQSMDYSARTLSKVILAQFVLFGVLLFVQMKIYPEGNFFLEMAFYLIVSYSLYTFGSNLTKKRFSELSPSGDKLDAMIKKTMSDISYLSTEEVAMLQNLVDARNDGDIFPQKLEMALRFGKLSELEFLKEIADYVNKNHG